ncbi:MAG: efflux RND transporter periplasmic adaptor subunit [Acidobacteriota bacterium]
MSHILRFFHAAYAETPRHGDAVNGFVAAGHAASTMRKCVWLTAISTSLALGGCKGAKVAPKPNEVPVTVAQAVKKTVPLAVEAVGTVEAYNSVTILSRVPGELLEIHYREGQDVEKGAPLVTIDPAPYKEALREAEARLTRDKAALEFKKAEADRYKFLFEKGAVSQSDYDKARTEATAHDETIRADEAEVEQARLDLSYCYITAPILARTGRYLVREGALVEANKTELVVVNQIRPIFVEFSIPEKHLPDVRKYLREGTLRVTAAPAGLAGAARAGAVTFVDNAVDTNTGMIMLKAEFPNEDSFLWPGQFVTVQMALTMHKDAIVVPSQAVLMGQKGQYVFVVGPDLTAQMRMIASDQSLGGETVVASGLGAGETVVTDGQNRLQNGSKVQIKTASDGASTPQSAK